MVQEFGESVLVVRQFVLLVLPFILRLQRCHTGSLALLVLRRPTCFGARSK